MRVNSLKQTGLQTKVEKQTCLYSDKEEFMEWTNEQKQAIYEKGSNILVAAAARKW